MSVDRDDTNGHPLVKCPACDHWLPEEDFDRQRVHMMANHPTLVNERLQESRRFDGWEAD